MPPVAPPLESAAALVIQMSSSTLVRFQLQTALPTSQVFIGDCQGDPSGTEDVFYLERKAEKPTLAHLRHAFPIEGNFHFRCLSRKGGSWIDMVHEDSALVLQDDQTCTVKALDLTALNVEEGQSASGEEDQDALYENELVRLEEVGAEYEQRPKCSSIDKIPPPEAKGGGIGADSTVRDVAKAGIESAKNIGKKLGNVVGGLFKRGKQ